MTHHKPVAIIGLGLIGGSLARALSRARVPILGYDPQVTSVPKKIKLRLYDSLRDMLFEAQERQALIVVAVPFPQLDHVFSQINDGTIDLWVTDVTSVKVAVHHLADQHQLSNRFFGGHPMAGLETSGWDAGIRELFKDKKWVITRDPRYAAMPIPEQIPELIAHAGAHMVEMDPTEHDHHIAAVSHMPHVFAEILAILGAESIGTGVNLAAGSFADATRVARTRPELVQAMLENNASEVHYWLTKAISLLSDVRHRIEVNDNLETLITSGYLAKKHLDGR